MNSEIIFPAGTEVRATDMQGNYFYGILLNDLTNAKYGKVEIKEVDTEIKSTLNTSWWTFTERGSSKEELQESVSNINNVHIQVYKILMKRANDILDALSEMIMSLNDNETSLATTTGRLNRSEDLYRLIQKYKASLEIAEKLKDSQEVLFAAFPVHTRADQIEKEK